MAKSLRVLIVEDSENDALIVLRHLRGGGYDPKWERVDTAEAMRSALEREQWDVVLCDYKMPRFDALAALKLIQEKQIDIPFIIVSGTIGEETAVAAMKSGAHDYIMKDRLSRLTVTIEKEIRDAELRKERNRIEQELRESEKRYRMVFENSPVSLWEEDFSRVKAFLDNLKKDGVTDLETYFDQHPEALQRCAEMSEILDVNHAACVLHGAVSKEELLAGLVNTFTPESFDTFRQELACLWKGGTKLTRDAVVKTLSGQTRYVNVSFSVVPGFEDTLSKIIVSLSDITERRRMEQKLRESEEQYRLLAENASDIIMLMDMNAKPVYFSTSVTRLLGYTVAEALTGSVNDRMTPASAEKAVKHFMAGLDMERQHPGSSSGQTLELDMIHKNGSVVIIEMKVSFIRDTSGKPSGMMAILRDITERRKVETEILQLSNAFRATLDPVLIFDMQGNAVNANEAARKLFERDELGVNALEAIAPEDKERVAVALQDLLVHGRPSVAQFSIVTRGGRKVPVEASGSVMLDAGGKPAGIVVVERDLTERKQAEGRQKLAAEILGILNEPLALPDAINRILAAIKQETGFYAVGIRLRKDEDFPYFVQNGFSEDFLLTENTLVARDSHGGICRGKDGKVSLECTCGLVISGKTDPSNPLFTPGGSAWTNDALPILDLPEDQDPRLHPRNRCIHAGFQSVALMPIRSGNEIVGLLQLNDRRKGCFTLEMIHFFEGIAASIGVALMRKQAEDAVRESELKYRSLVEQSLLGIVVIQQGRVVYMNHMMEEKGGYTLDDLAAMSQEQLKEIIYPEDREAVWNRMLSRLSGKEEPVRNESRFIAKDGSLYWADVHTNIGQYLGKSTIQMFIVDITDRKRAEDALRRSEAKMRSLFEVSPDVIMNIDRQGKILFINKATTKTVEETIGTTVYDYIPPEYQSLYAQTIENVFRTGKPDRIETKGLGPGRRISWYEARFVYIGMGGEEDTLMVVATDVTERKKAEEARKESEEKFRTAFDSANIGMCLVGLNGSLMKVNTKMSEILGYSAEELERMTVDSITHPDDIDVSPRFMKKAIDGELEGSTFEKRYRDKGGNTVWGLVSSALVHDADGAPLYFISQLQDITERKKMEEALRASEEKFSAAFRLSPVAVVLSDLKDGRYVEISDRTGELSGYSKEEAIGRTATELGIWPDAKDRELFTRKLREEGRLIDQEVTMRDKSGRDHAVSASAEVVTINHQPYLLSICMDITERKQAEMALRESEEKYRLVVDNANECMVVLQDGLIKFGNNRFTEVIGYTPQEYLQKPFLDFIYPDDRSTTGDRYMRRLKGSDIAGTNQFRMVDKAGNPKWAQLNVTLMEWEGRTATLALFNDVTERKKAEEALQEQYSTLRGIIDSANALIFSVNRQYRYTSFNSGHATTMKTLYGFDIEIGRSILDYMTVSIDREMAKDNIDRALIGEQLTAEAYSGDELRSRRYFQVSHSPIKTKSGDIIGVAVMSQDITERKKAEEALRSSEEKYRGIFDESVATIYVFDNKKNFIDTNQAGVDLLGYSREELLRRSIPDVDADPVVVLPAHEELLTGGRLINYEHRLRRKDGTIITVLNNSRPLTDDKGNVIGMQSTLVDITERKKAEEALHGIEERIKSIVSTSQEWIWAIDARGDHTFSNPAIEDILGYRPDEVIGRNALDLLFEDDVSMVRQILNKCIDMKTGWSNLVLRWKHKNGGYRYLESNAVPILDSAGVLCGFQGADRDITERKRAEQNLRETRDYMENLIEHANVPMVVWTPDYRITRFNRAFERLTGLKTKAVIGKDLEILFPKETRERSMSFMRTAVKGARWEVVELPIMNVDGDTKTVLWNISAIYAEDRKTPIAIIAQGQDITERKKTEERLRESEEMARSMLDSAAMGIYLLQDKKFLYVNPTFEKILGYSSEELVGKETLNYVHANDRAIVRIRAVENLKAISTQPYEFRALRKDGRQIWVMERVTSIKYKGKRAVIASFMETTEHKKAEENLEQAYEELKTAHDRMVQSEKLRAMGEMASGIAHDFNNMLAVILGRTQLVIDDVKDDKVKKGIQIIEQAALDAAKTVKRLQDFARIRVEHPFEVLDVNEIIDGVLKMVETRRVEMEQTKSIGIKVEHLLGKVGRVSGDAAELREALLNILFNALDAMPTGGKLTVKTEQDENWVQISIRDTGVGIPDKVKSKVFQPFFTTKASKGSGLGLSVTYGIIARHNGMIKFDSDVGKGTTFSIRLPLAIEAARQEAKKRKTAAAKPANILTVDDEAEVLRALDLTLEYFGHWVKGVTSGAEAVKAFKDGNYDLVITDLGMPGMSGWDVARAIKKINPDMPVLLITGWVIDLDEEQKTLVNGVIAKPFSRESISSALSQVFSAKKKGAKKPVRKKKSE